MFNNDASDEDVIATVQKRGITFKLTPEMAQRMKDNEVSEPVIKALQDAPVKEAQPNNSPFKKETEQIKGDPDKAFKEADVVSEGVYGCPVITHCCMESHGSIAEWTDSDHLFSHISTQNVSGLAGQFAQALKIPEAISTYIRTTWVEALAASLASTAGAHTPRRYPRKPAVNPYA